MSRLAAAMMRTSILNLAAERIADTPDFLLLDGAQQFRLSAGGEVCNLVEQQGPAASFLEQTGPVDAAPENTPFAWPKSSDSSSSSGSAAQLRS